MANKKIIFYLFQPLCIAIIVLFAPIHGKAQSIGASSFDSLFVAGMSQVENIELQLANQTFLLGQLSATQSGLSYWGAKFALRRYVVARRMGKASQSLDLLDSILSVVDALPAENAYFKCGVLNYKADFLRAFGLIDEGKIVLSNAEQYLDKNWTNYDSLKAELLLTKGQITIREKDFEKSAKAFEFCFEYFKNTNAYYSLGKAALFGGESYLGLRNYERASYLYNEAYNAFIKEDGYFSSAITQVLLGQSKVASYQNEFKKALILAKKAIALGDSINLSYEHKSNLQFNIGNIYLQSQQQLDLAKKHFFIALEIAKKHLNPNNLIIAEIYSNLAGYYNYTYDLRKAIHFMDQAISFYSIHNYNLPSKTAMLHMNRGFNYMKINQVELAEKDLKKVISILQKTWYESSFTAEIYVFSIAGLINIYSNSIDDIKQLNKYSELFESATKKQIIVDNKNTIASQLNVSLSFLLNDSLDIAERIFKSVRNKITPQVSYSITQEYHQLNGILNLRKGNYELAIQAFVQSERTLGLEFNNRMAIVSKGYRAYAMALQANQLPYNEQIAFLDSAKTLAENSLKLIAQIDKNGHYSDLRKQMSRVFFVNKVGLFFVYSALHKIGQEGDYNRLAFLISKEVLYNGANSTQNDSLDAKLIDLEFQLFDLNNKKSANNILKKEIKQKIAALLNESNRKTNNKFNESPIDFTSDLENTFQLQKELAKTKRCIVSFFSFQSTLFGFFIDKDKFELHTLSTDYKSILPFKAFNSIVNRTDDAQENLGKISEIYYQKWPSWVKSYKNIAIIPFAEINIVPWDALVDENNVSLIFKHSFSIARELSDFKVEQNFYRQNEIDLHIFEPNVDIQKLALTYKSNYDTNLDQLTFTKAETQQIASLFPKNQSFLDLAANKNQLKRSFEHANIIHIATHTIAQTEDGFNTRMLFQPDDNQASAYFLYEPEVALWQGMSDMIVLSSCNSGIGDLGNPNSMISFSNRFYDSGAKSVVNSLWDLPDRTTASIILSFYKNLLNGHSKDDALRLAKLDYLKTADKAQIKPFFWAPIQVLGNTCPLFEKQITKPRLDWLFWVKLSFSSWQLWLF